jgi:ketosteroid isomerase-like protein
MAHPNEDRTREAYAAFSRGDFDALKHQFWADDIHYHVPGRAPTSGDYEGADQVLGFFKQSFELTGGTLRLELHDVLANDEHAVSLVTMRAERAGKKLETNLVQVAHVRDGKTTESWLCPADPDAMEDFWS